MSIDPRRERGHRHCAHCEERLPRKRRTSKRRAELPTGLAAVSLCERALWTSYGPLIDGDGDDLADSELYALWPSWEAWGVFYGAVRDELFRDRPRLKATSIAEQLYVGISAGDDPETLRHVLVAERRADDPRKVLCAS